MRRLLPVLAVLSVVSAIGARATTIVGPGNVAATNFDSASPLIAVDLNNPQSLAAGTYTATFFNHEFAGGATGSVAPLLLTGNGVNTFTTIALGTALAAPLTGTGFVSTAFGGSNTFTLGATTTVYAGVYWTGVVNMPLRFATTGSSFLRYQGAAAPVVGSPISGGATVGNPFARSYDFSISIEPVPEPATGALVALGLVALGCRRRS